MQARTFLHNVRPGLLVIPVHAQLVLLGQIMLLLPTKVHAQPARHVLRVGKPPLLVQQRQILVHVLIVMRGSTEPGRLQLSQRVIPANSKLEEEVLKIAMQDRTFLHNVRLGLLVIPVDAYLVLLGQIMQVLPTKVHAQPARHVLRVRKPQLHSADKLQELQRAVLWLWMPKPQNLTLQT